MTFKLFEKRLLIILLAAALILSSLSLFAFADDTSGEPETTATPETSPEPETTTDPESTGTPETSTPEETTGEPERQALSFTVDYGTGRHEYYEGESFSAEGYTITVLYSDFSHEPADPATISFSPAGPLTPDVTGVTFSCTLVSGTSVTKGITVTPATGIEVQGSCKDVYRAGAEAFDPTGLELYVKFADNTLSADKIPLNVATFTPGIDAPIPSGTENVTVSYLFNGKEISSQIPVTVKSPVSITVVSGPAKLWEGFPLSLTTADFTVTAGFEGEEGEIPVTNFTIEDLGAPITHDAEGKMKIGITLENLAAEFETDVEPLNLTKLRVNGPKTDYYIGDVPSLDGVSVVAEWTDGRCEDVTAYLSTDIPAVYMPGEVMHAAFGLQNVPLDEVAVFHTATLTLLRQPDKTDYNEGEIFDKTGLIAVVTYDDGTHQQNLTAEEITVANTSPLASSDSYVKISWNGIEAEIGIRVFTSRKIKSISIKTNPDKIRYIEGEKLDLTGIVIRIEYDDGESEDLTDLDKVTTDPDLDTPLAANGRPITLRYSLSPTLYYETVIRDITVSKSNITAIAVTTQPSKTQYSEGDEFMPTGIVVSAIYDNGKMAELPATAYEFSGNELVENRFILREGGTRYKQVSIIVKYLNTSCVLTVDVLPKSVRSLTAAEAPARTEYRSGDFFDPTGLVIRAEFADGTSFDLPEDYYIIDPVRPLADGDRTVTVSFRDALLSIPVTVLPSQTETTTDETTAEDPGTSDAGEETVTAPEDTSTGTAAPSPVTTTPETSAQSGSSGGCRKINTVMLLWIIIIIIIAAALIGLIVYYRRNFT